MLTTASLGSNITGSYDCKNETSVAPEIMKDIFELEKSLILLKIIL